MHVPKALLQAFSVAVQGPFICGRSPCSATEDACSNAYGTCILVAGIRHHLLGKSASAKANCGVRQEAVQGLLLGCGNVAQTGY